MKDANVESLNNLRSNLAEISLKIEDLPLVFQYNKRDLSNILTVQELEETLNPQGLYESYEACAVVGQGVFETLKAISKLTLRSLKKRMLGDDRTSILPPRRLPRPVARPRSPPQSPAAALPGRRRRPPRPPPRAADHPRRSR